MQSNAMQSKAKQSKAQQSKAKQSGHVTHPKQSKAKQSKAIERDIQRYNERYRERYMEKKTLAVLQLLVRVTLESIRALFQGRRGAAGRIAAL
jgi:hypothetical protein